MKKYFLSILLSAMLALHLQAMENETPLKNNNIYHNFLLNLGVEGYLDDWMAITYGLTPSIGLEFSTTLSPNVDGIIQGSFSHKNGSYAYTHFENEPSLQTELPEIFQNQEWHDFSMTYEKLGFGLRICDSRFKRRAIFIEAALDAAMAQERNEQASLSGGAVGSHLGVGFWAKIRTSWLIQAKGEIQLLSIPMKESYDFRSYDFDLSGIKLILGVGVSK